MATPEERPFPGGRVYHRATLAMDVGAIVKSNESPKKCRVWNYDGNGAQTKHCTTRNLNTGSDSGRWEDVDIFTFLGTSYTVSINGADQGRKAAGQYTRIHDNQKAECGSDQDGTYCVVGKK